MKFDDKSYNYRVKTVGSDTKGRTLNIPLKDERTETLNQQVTIATLSMASIRALSFQHGGGSSNGTIYELGTKCTVQNLFQGGEGCRCYGYRCCSRGWTIPYGRGNPAPMRGAILLL